MSAVEQQSHCVSRIFILPESIANYINFPFLQFCRRIADNLHEYLPNLESIILTGNNLQEFSDLDSLLQLPKLETLSLLTKPIITKPNYREYIAFK